MSPDPTPKFRRRSDARPDEILDAALRLFTAKGFAQTRVDEIAAAAGLSKGAVYLYFPSKESLLEGLVRRAVEPVARMTVDRLSDRAEHPRTTLSRALHAVAAALEEPDVLAVPMLVIREAPGMPRIAELYRDAVLARVIPAVARLVADGIRAGQLRPVDPDLTVRTLIGPLLMHLLLARVFGIVPPGGLAPGRLIDNHLGIVFDGLATGRGTAS